MKQFTLTLLLVCVTFGLKAQEGFKFGFRLAPLISWATIIDSETKDRLDMGQSSRTGISYGLMANYGFTSNYAFNTGVHIVTKGYKSIQDTTQAEVNTRVTALEIPLGIKLRSNDVGNGVYIKGMFGFNVEINTGYKQTIDGGAESRNTNRINTLTSSFFFGGGIEKEIENVGIFDFGIRYVRGLSNVNNKDNGYPNGNPRPNTIVRLSYVSFDVGYYF